MVTVALRKAVDGVGVVEVGDGDGVVEEEDVDASTTRIIAMGGTKRTTVDKLQPTLQDPTPLEQQNQPKRWMHTKIEQANLTFRLEHTNIVPERNVKSARN